ncbi:MAG: acyl-CoA dehydrogenase family protein, partial [Ilumatobacteraceae bacterium]
MSPTPDLTAAAGVIEVVSNVVGKATRNLAALGGPDTQQVLAYDVAHASSALHTARSMLDYGAKGDDEARLTCVFVADMAHEVATRVLGREAMWGVDAGAFSAVTSFVAQWRDPDVLAGLAEVAGPRHLDDEYEMVQDTFRSFAVKEIAPRAEHVHRHNADVPEEIISGLAEIGAFGLSVPSEYGGFSEGGDGEYMASCIATEELSRASLGIGGSLITRPEILTRALVRGGTEAQKHHWLPKLATTDVMAAVAVTEPDYGSDVASLKTTAVRGTSPDGAAGWVINGVKTWCTFGARANVLMLLARTDPDRSKAHKGLSVFIVPKPIGDAHGFVFTQPGGGRMEGR